MSKAPSMPLFTDAYLGDTMHLSMEEHGAYLKLLIIHWRLLPKHPPDDDRRLARMLGVSVARWRKIKPVICDEVLYRIEAGELRQKRLEKEFRYVTERAQIARQNGRKGARARALSNKESDDPAGIATGVSLAACGSKPAKAAIPCHHTQAHTQTPMSVPKGPGDRTPSLAQSLWSDSPGSCLNYLKGAGVSQPRSLLGKWRSLAVARLGREAGEAAVLAAVLAAERNHASAPEAYITKILQRRLSESPEDGDAGGRLRPPSVAESEAWARGGAVPRLVADDNPWPPGWLRKQAARNV